MDRRVVITGMGALSPLGCDVASTWQGLVQGRSGIAPITLFDTTGHDVRIAGDVKGFDATAVVGTKLARRTDRFVHLAITAAREAVAQAGLVVDAGNAERVGVIIGSGKCRPGPGDVAPGTIFLQKPYPLETLVREVRRLAGV